MKLARTIMTVGFATLLSTAAMAAEAAPQQTATTPIKSVSNMPDGSEVTITGTVEDFDSRHPITLRDQSGTINVDLSDVKPIVLHDGQKVTITGDVDKGFLGTDVAATDVHL